MIKKNEDISKLIKESDIAFAKGDYIKAIELLQSSLGEDPTNMETHYRLGIILSKMEKYEDSIKHLDVILDNEYQFLHLIHVITLKGYALTKLYRFKEAKQCLTAALKYEGKDTNILSMLAFMHYKTKDYDVAERIYDKILKIDNNNFTALNSKGFMLIDTKKDIEKGLEYCRKAYDINPDSPAVLDSIGWAYYKLGEIEKSATYLKRAFEILPNNKEIKSHLRSIATNT